MARELTNEDNVELLDSLITSWEDETIEFKETSNDFDTNRVGRYVSALSNEANLADAKSSWLVFGIKNKTRAVVGAECRTDVKRKRSQTPDKQRRRSEHYFPERQDRLPS